MSQSGVKNNAIDRSLSYNPSGESEMSFAQTLLAPLLLWEQIAVAAVHCVATPDDLTVALLAAQQNSTGSDEIRLRTGLYAAPDGGWHVDVQLRGIDIEGGYTDAACQTRTFDAAQTVLDGRHMARPLTIDTSFAGQQIATGIVVRDLTFANGAGDRAGGLKVSDAGQIYDGTILIEGNIFRDNAASVFEQDNSGGGLLAATDGNTFDGTVFLTVRNNLFAGNRANDGAAAMLFSNDGIDVSNNTVTDNQSFDTTIAERRAFALFTFAQTVYSNNVFWANNPDNLPGTFDIRADNPFHADLSAVLLNNDLQNVLGTPGAQQGALSADPMFVDAASGDFRPGALSQLIDAGMDAPAGGASATDLDGRPRLQGAHIDIGAYESERIFKDGFE
jgi:hypothetical protein